MRAAAAGAAYFLILFLAGFVVSTLFATDL